MFLLPAGLVSFMLPETFGVPLPYTIQASSYTRAGHKSFCCRVRVNATVDYFLHAGINVVITDHFCIMDNKSQGVTC